jgi:hypothetical protein
LRRLGHSGATRLFGWAGWRRLSRSSCRVCISSCRFCRSSGRLRLLLRLWRTRLLLLQPSRQWSRACRRRRSWGGGAANLPVLCDHRTLVPHDQPRLQSHGTTHAAAAPLHPRRGERRSRAPVLSWERALPTKAATPSASRLEHVLVAAPACVVDVKSNREPRAWTYLGKCHVRARGLMIGRRILLGPHALMQNNAFHVHISLSFHVVNVYLLNRNRRAAQIGGHPRPFQSKPRLAGRGTVAPRLLARAAGSPARGDPSAGSHAYCRRMVAANGAQSVLVRCPRLWCAG